jgi:hypothetical protein
MDGSKVKELEKGLKLDEQLVRYLVVKTVRENTVYTKRAPVIKVESLVNNETDDVINIDTTADTDVLAEITPEVLAEIAPEVIPEEITSEVTK